MLWLRSRGLELPLILIQVGNKRTMRRGLAPLGGQQQVLAQRALGGGDPISARAMPDSTESCCWAPALNIC